MLILILVFDYIRWPFALLTSNDYEGSVDGTGFRTTKSTSESAELRHRFYEQNITHNVTIKTVLLPLQHHRITLMFDLYKLY